MKSTVRAFVAIDIAPSIRSEARKSLRPVQKAFPDVKWVDDDNFHVTLKFLGPNVPTTELHHVIEAIKKACENFEQFDLVFEGLGAFPDASNPRTIWIGVREGVDELRALARRIDDELGKLGFPQEGREFSPHLTIGRTRKRDREDDQFASNKRRFNDRSRRDDQDEELEPGAFSALTRMIYDRSNVFFGSSPVDSVVLYSSELERNGPKYEPLAEIELSPLGSSLEFDDPFDPSEYDDEDFHVDENGMEEHLPEKLDVKLDVDALDAEVEAELRAICGSNFAKKSSGKKTKAPGKPQKPRSSAKIDDDVPELNDLDLDLSQFGEFKNMRAERKGSRKFKK